MKDNNKSERQSDVTIAKYYCSACTTAQLIFPYSGTHTTYNMTNFKINTCPQTMFINPVSENEVEKVVTNLKGKCSSGFDGVTDCIVKKFVQFIKKPLAGICNTSFASGIFPEILKIALVKPLHKKGNTGEVQNYRPMYQSSQRL